MRKQEFIKDLEVLIIAIDRLYSAVKKMNAKYQMGIGSVDVNTYEHYNLKEIFCEYGERTALSMVQDALGGKSEITQWTNGDGVEHTKESYTIPGFDHIIVAYGTTIKGGKEE